MSPTLDAKMAEARRPMEAEHPLATARKAGGVSQKVLAIRVGCKRWMINSIEAGERRPSMLLLSRLVAETGVSADSVLRWDATRNRVARLDAQKVLRRVPVDNRSVTARLMGDPLPGRGAGS